MCPNGLKLLIVTFAQFVTPVKVQQSLYWPIVGQRFFQEDEAPRFPDIRHMKVVRLSALHTVHLYPPGNISGAHFFQELS